MFLRLIIAAYVSILSSNAMPFKSTPEFKANLIQSLELINKA